MTETTSDTTAKTDATPETDARLHPDTYRQETVAYVDIPDEIRQTPLEVVGVEDDRYIRLTTDRGTDYRLDFGLGRADVTFDYRPPSDDGWIAQNRLPVDALTLLDPTGQPVNPNQDETTEESTDDAESDTHSGAESDTEVELPNDWEAVAPPEPTEDNGGGLDALFGEDADAVDLGATLSGLDVLELMRGNAVTLTWETGDTITLYPPVTDGRADE